MTPSLEIVTKLVDQYKDINYAIDNINCGGCGIFAEHLYKTLLKLNVDAKILVFTPIAEEMEKRINGEDHHIVIEVDGKLIDSDGIYGSIDETIYYDLQITYKLSLNKLSEWNDDYTIWNRSFDRDNIIKIESKLEKCYNYLTKSLEITK